MTDPFSVVTGVIGIVGVALSNTRQVYDFISGIKGAPEAVTTLYGDLDSLANILQQLSVLTRDPSQALFIVPLKGSLERCIAALKQLKRSIKPYVEGLQNGRRKWKRFAWNFKEKEVTALQVRLGSCRDNLQLAILLGIMMQQASGSDDIRVNFQKLQRTADGDRWSVAGSAVPSSGPQGSDYGYALRFLLEHESDLGSQLGDDLISDELKDEPVAGLISGRVLLERAVPPDIFHRSVSPGRSQQEFGHASGEYDAPERQRSDAAFNSTRQEYHASLGFASRIESTVHSRNPQGLAGETAPPLRHSSKTPDVFKDGVQQANQRLGLSEHKATSMTGQQQLSLPPRKSSRESPQASSRLLGAAGQRHEAIIEEQVMVDIAGPLFKGIRADRLTTQEQDELVDRFIEAYQQSLSTPGPLLRPSTRAKRNTPTGEIGPKAQGADGKQLLIPANLSSEAQQRTLTIKEIRGRVGDKCLENYLNVLESTEEALQAVAVALGSPGLTSLTQKEEVDHALTIMQREISSLNRRNAQIILARKQALLPVEWRDRLHRLHQKAVRVHGELLRQERARLEPFEHRSRHVDSERRKRGKKKEVKTTNVLH